MFYCTKNTSGGKKSIHTEIKVHILTYRDLSLKLLQVYLMCIHGFNYKVHWSLKCTLPLNNLKAVVLLWSDERIIGFATGPVNSPLSNHKCAHNSLSPALFLLGLSHSNSHTYKCTHAHKHINTNPFDRLKQLFKCTFRWSVCPFCFSLKK